MLHRMNGWQRLGVIASVIWLFWGGVWANRTIVDGIVPDSPQRGYSYCMEFGRKIEQECRALAVDNETRVEREMSQRWWGILGTAVIPLPLAWGLIYGLVWLVGWVAAGFRGKSA